MPNEDAWYEQLAEAEENRKPIGWVDEDAEAEAEHDWEEEDDR